MARTSMQVDAWGRWAKHLQKITAGLLEISSDEAAAGRWDDAMASMALVKDAAELASDLFTMAADPPQPVADEQNAQDASTDQLAEPA